jgi:hypothetical protein
MITFNTGRPYTDKGQRIGAEMSHHHESQVAFCDIDRGIFGLLPEGVGLNQGEIMSAYDAGNYDHCALYVEGYHNSLTRRVHTAFLGE